MEKNYQEYIDSPEFKQLMKDKKKFIRPYVIIFFLVYLTMPVLTGFTNILERQVFGWITGTWLYALGIFIMVWVFSMIYVKKSYQFDKDAENVVDKTILK